MCAKPRICLIYNIYSLPAEKKNGGTYAFSDHLTPEYHRVKHSVRWRQLKHCGPYFNNGCTFTFGILKHYLLGKQKVIQRTNPVFIQPWYPPFNPFSYSLGIPSTESLRPWDKDECPVLGCHSGHMIGRWAVTTRYRELSMGVHSECALSTETSVTRGNIYAACGC